MHFSGLLSSSSLPCLVFQSASFISHSQRVRSLMSRLVMSPNLLTLMVHVLFIRRPCWRITASRRELQSSRRRRQRKRWHCLVCPAIEQHPLDSWELSCDRGSHDLSSLLSPLAPPWMGLELWNVPQGSLSGWPFTQSPPSIPLRNGRQARQAITEDDPTSWSARTSTWRAPLSLWPLWHAFFC